MKAVGEFKVAHQRISRSLHLQGGVSVMGDEGEVTRQLHRCCPQERYCQTDARAAERFYVRGQMMFIQHRTQSSGGFNDLLMLLRGCRDYSSMNHSTQVHLFCETSKKTLLYNIRAARHGF